MAPADDLTSVWVSAASDVFAVGITGTLTRAKGQALVKDPESGVLTRLPLWKVRGTSVADVWAVGNGGTTLHYDGAIWSLVPINGPQTSEGHYGLWLDQAGGGWSIGDNDHCLQLSQGRWTVRSTGIMAGIGAAVWGSSPSNVWAVGCILGISHFDGTSWQQIAGTTDLLPPTSPNDCSSTVLTGIWGTGLQDIWAVGTNGVILRYGYWLD